MSAQWAKPRGTCECGDSIRTVAGCPPKGHREYTFCPKQKPVSTKREETGK